MREQTTQRCKGLPRMSRNNFNIRGTFVFFKGWRGAVSPVRQNNNIIQRRLFGGADSAMPSRSAHHHHSLDRLHPPCLPFYPFLRGRRTARTPTLHWCRDPFTSTTVIKWTNQGQRRRPLMAETTDRVTTQQSQSTSSGELPIAVEGIDPQV